MKLIDVTVPLDAALPVYPGNTPFTLEPVKRIASGGSSNVSSLHMSAHTGTHVDAPRHFYDDGGGVETLPLEWLMGPARVIDAPDAHAIGPEHLQALAPGDRRVLIRTRNSQLWGSPVFHQDYVGLSADGAAFLVGRGVRVVGVDYLSVEEFRKPGAPAHHILLGGGTIVIEGLNLRDVSAGPYELYCLPLCVVGSDGAPARVVLGQA